MQNLVRSKTIGVTGNGGRDTAGAGPGRHLLYYRWPKMGAPSNHSKMQHAHLQAMEDGYIGLHGKT